MNNKWKYYNNALIPAGAPHDSLDEESLKNNPLWKNKKTLFARWTTDFDCGYETPWWFCIKDEPFDIDKVNAKKRYEINKGKKNFEIRLIEFSKYIDEMYEVYISGSKEETLDIGDRNREGFIREIDGELKYGLTMFGAFHRESGKLCGYAYARKRYGYINYMTHKVDPAYEKIAVNAALVEGVLSYFADDIKNGIYLCDGERSVYHETRFQDYLERYFEFRKAYCRLNLKYKPLLGLIVKMIYPYRKIIGKVSFMKKVFAVLKMHDYFKKSNEKGIY